MCGDCGVTLRHVLSGTATVRVPELAEAADSMVDAAAQLENAGRAAAREFADGLKNMSVTVRAGGELSRTFGEVNRHLANADQYAADCSDATRAAYRAAVADAGRALSAAQRIANRGLKVADHFATAANVVANGFVALVAVVGAWVVTNPNATMTPVTLAAALAVSARFGAARFVALANAYRCHQIVAGTDLSAVKLIHEQLLPLDGENAPAADANANANATATANANAAAAAPDNTPAVPNAPAQAQPAVQPAPAQPEAAAAQPAAGASGDVAGPTVNAVAAQHGPRWLLGSDPACALPMADRVSTLRRFASGVLNALRVGPRAVRKVFAFCIVGCQQTGKSTLINLLSGAALGTGTNSGRETTGLQAVYWPMRDDAFPYDFMALDSEGVQSRDRKELYQHHYRQLSAGALKLRMAGQELRLALTTVLASETIMFLTTKPQDNEVEGERFSILLRALCMAGAAVLNRKRIIILVRGGPPVTATQTEQQCIKIVKTALGTGVNSLSRPDDEKKADGAADLLAKATRLLADAPVYFLPELTADANGKAHPHTNAAYLAVVQELRKRVREHADELYARDALPALTAYLNDFVAGFGSALLVDDTDATISGIKPAQIFRRHAKITAQTAARTQYTHDLKDDTCVSAQEHKTRMADAELVFSRSWADIMTGRDDKQDFGAPELEVWTETKASLENLWATGYAPCATAMNCRVPGHVCRKNKRNCKPSAAANPPPPADPSDDPARHKCPAPAHYDCDAKANGCTLQTDFICGEFPQHYPKQHQKACKRCCHESDPMFPDSAFGCNLDKRVHGAHTYHRAPERCQGQCDRGCTYKDSAVVQFCTLPAGHNGPHRCGNTKQWLCVKGCGRKSPEKACSSFAGDFEECDFVKRLCDDRNFDGRIALQTADGHYLQHSFGVGPNKAVWNIRPCTYNNHHMSTWSWIFFDGINDAWKCDCSAAANNNPFVHRWNPNNKSNVGLPQDWEAFQFHRGTNPLTDVKIRNCHRGWIEVAGAALRNMANDGTSFRVVFL